MIQSTFEAKPRCPRSPLKEEKQRHYTSFEERTIYQAGLGVNHLSEIANCVSFIVGGQKNGYHIERELDVRKSVSSKLFITTQPRGPGDSLRLLESLKSILPFPVFSIIIFYHCIYHRTRLQLLSQLPSQDNVALQLPRSSSRTVMERLMFNWSRLLERGCLVGFAGGVGHNNECWIVPLNGDKAFFGWGHIIEYKIFPLS